MEDQLSIALDKLRRIQRDHNRIVELFRLKQELDRMNEIIEDMKRDRDRTDKKILKVLVERVKDNQIIENTPWQLTIIRKNPNFVFEIIDGYDVPKEITALMPYRPVDIFPGVSFNFLMGNVALIVDYNYADFIDKMSYILNMGDVTSKLNGEW